MTLLSCKIADSHASLSRGRVHLSNKRYFPEQEAIFHSKREGPMDRLTHLLCVEDEWEEAKVGRHQLRASHDARDLKKKQIRLILFCSTALFFYLRRSTQVYRWHILFFSRHFLIRWPENHTTCKWNDERILNNLVMLNDTSRWRFANFLSS